MSESLLLERLNNIAANNSKTVSDVVIKEFSPEWIEEALSQGKSLQELLFAIPSSFSEQNNNSDNWRLEVLLNSVAQMPAIKKSEYSNDRFHAKEVSLGAPSEANPNAGLIFKSSTRDSENGPKSAHYADRVLSLIEGAEYYIQLDKYSGDKLSADKRLQKLKRKFQKILNKEFNVESELTLRKSGTSRREQYLKTIEEKFHDFLQLEVMPGIVEVIKKNQESDDSITKELFRCEVENRAKKGRASHINFFQLPTRDGKCFTNHFSVQIPLGRYTKEQLAAMGLNSEKVAYYTNPSNKRWSEGLANYVLHATGYIDDKGNYHVTDTFTRHASYVPIKIKDRVKRLQMAVRALKQELEMCARFQLANTGNNFTDGEEIKVEFTEISLLSVINRLVPAAVDPQQQFRQTYENNLVFNLLQNEKFECEIEGKKIKIIPDMNYMVAGVNSARHEYMNDDLQDEINNHSYNKFLDTVSAYLSDASAKNVAEEESIRRLLGIISVQNKEFPELIKQRKDFQQTHHNLYQQLFSPSLDEKLLKDQLGIIDKQRTDLNEEVLEQLEARAEQWEKYRPEIITIFNQLDQQSKFYEFIKLFIQCQDLFLNKKYYDIKYNYCFQEAFLKLNKLMKRHVGFHCNDTEDRSGNLSNMIETSAAIQFQEATLERKVDVTINLHNDPHYKKLHAITQEFSTSVENAGENVPGACALELHAKDGISHLKPKINRLIGERAKVPYRKPSLFQKVKSFFTTKTKSDFSQKAKWFLPTVFFGFLVFCGFANADNLNKDNFDPMNGGYSVKKDGDPIGSSEQNTQPGRRDDSAPNFMVGIKEDREAPSGQSAPRNGNDDLATSSAGLRTKDDNNSGEEESNVVDDKEGYVIKPLSSQSRSSITSPSFWRKHSINLPINGDVSIGKSLRQEWEAVNQPDEVPHPVAKPC